MGKNKSNVQILKFYAGVTVTFKKGVQMNFHYLQGFHFWNLMDTEFCMK